MTVDQFLKQEKAALMQLLSETQQLYGRTADVIRVGRHVQPWSGDVKFMEVPLRREEALEPGEVFALVNEATAMEKMKARWGTGRRLVSR